MDEVLDIVESIDEVRGTNFGRLGPCRDFILSKSEGEIGGDSLFVIFEVTGADTLRNWWYLSSSLALPEALASSAGAL
jgi:hypothetical protein